MLTRLTTILLALAFALACSSDGISGLGGKKGGGKSGGGKSGGKSGDKSGEDVEIDVGDSGAKFQVKDVNLLRSSVISCMGSEDMIKVTEDMLISGTAGAAALPDAKIRFLAGNAFKAGDDIVLKLRGDLVDPEKAARTSTAADGVTDTYLRALEGIANVVAHNCSLDNEFCECDDKAKVKKIIARCMPGINPKTKAVDTAANRLAETCSDGGAKGMREAIATLLSSYAFAAAR